MHSHESTRPFCYGDQHGIRPLDAEFVFIAYKTAFDGCFPRPLCLWLLNTDALVALVFVAADLFALQQINARSTAPPAIRP
jgi:hypothetical protein